VYGPDDLIYYNIPTKSLDEGLELLSCDHDVIEIVEHHNEHGLVELYLVAFWFRRFRCRRRRRG
jgi:hypothetical protein